MKFERIVKLANETPVGVLCEAWGTTAEAVTSRLRSEVPMSVREAGALAHVHGMKLQDVLAI